jgi:drug/metabolite transporter (DMT)-like permease
LIPEAERVYLCRVNRNPDSKALQWIILLALALVWGSSFILMKRGLESFTSQQVAALRMFIAFIFLLPLAYRHLKKEHLVHWKGFLATGLLGNFIPAFLFTEAETGISSALTGMLNSLTPLFTLILGVMLFQAKTKWLNVLGVIIGFVGAIGLLTVGKSEEMNNNMLFGLYVVIATICYGLSVNIIKKWLNGVNSVTITVWAFVMVGPPAGVYLFTTDFLDRLQTQPQAWQSLGYIVILAVFGTALSVIVFNVLIKMTNALFASSVTYLIPIVAIGWGFFDGEGIEMLHFIWIGLILLGVYLVNRKPKASQRNAGVSP